MARASKTPDIDYILLCLVRMHPNISGYQLCGIINNSAGFFFRAHLSQVYPALKRLTEANLVEFSRVKRDSQPDLKLYRITDEGVKAAHEWLTRPFIFERTRANTDRFFLKLILMGHLELGEIANFVNQGLVALQCEREEIIRENFQVERDLAEGLQEPHLGRYMKLWDHTSTLVLHELDERITWLEELRRDLSGESASLSATEASFDSFTQSEQVGEPELTHLA